MELALSVPPLNSGSYAFFFDLDGTLAEIQHHPHQVTIPRVVRQHLSHLAQMSNGALALVSGRTIAELDKLTFPLRVPLAGVHGAERRDSRNKIHIISLPPAVLTPLQQALEDGMREFKGAQLEIKGMAFALHYRNAPGDEAAIYTLARRLVAHYDGLALQPGKCVVEIKPKGVNKGAAIAAFMQEAPFSERTPVFVGDDLTDETGFDVVNCLNGISIKVGNGDTRAQYRLHDVQAVYRWLEHATYSLEKEQASS